MKTQEQIEALGEFYQLDFEMSFATQEDVFEALENVVLNTFKKHTNWQVDESPIKKIPYKEAMEKYGTDKPDLRNPLIIQDVTNIFNRLEFNAFKIFDNLTEYAMQELGAKGLAWLKIEQTGEMTGGISKFIDEQANKELLQISNKKDAIVFVADELKTVQKIAGGLRTELGKKLYLLQKECYRFCLIVDFPMYELSEEGTIDFNHNPFSMPQGGMEALLNKNPLDILAYQYDLVCNGYELASGAVRNHDQEIMLKAFEIAGYKEEDVKKKFGALYNAFSYGTPPHAGAAPGIDRMVMLIAQEDNIREVIAFPKNKKARDLLMQAPSAVTEQQLKDVHIKLDI